MKNRDHLYTELYNVRSDMRGISPKTETYKKLEKKKIELEILLDEDPKKLNEMFSTA